MSKTIHKKAEPTKYTDEELEREFEEALRSVNEDRLAAIRIFSKTTTMLMSLCITVLSLLALIGGGILVFQNVPLLMNIGISIEFYFFHGILAIIGLFMVILGCGLLNDYIL